MTTIRVKRQPRMTRVRAERAWPGPRAPGRQGSPKAVCSACGAVMEVDEGVPHVQQEDARFCTSCWRGLTPAQVERVGRDVALRGVPL
jgi:predicted RNA-binding Zn-ribbon protein involved in translation (DUF1610 family)